MNHAVQASAGMSLTSCGLLWVSEWVQILSANGQLVAAACAIVTTASTVALGVLNYRLNVKRAKNDG